MELIKNLPELQGTEKQIDWANKIRNGFLMCASSYLDGSNEAEEIAKANNVLSVTDASFWIDNRNCMSVDALVKQLARDNTEITEALPELEGTEKQISFATGIRKNFFLLFTERKEASNEELKNKIFGNTSAEFWIKYRNQSIRLLIEMAKR